MADSRNLSISVFLLILTKALREQLVNVQST
jgi:hypothetical protein